MYPQTSLFSGPYFDESSPSATAGRAPRSLNRDFGLSGANSLSEKAVRMKKKRKKSSKRSSWKSLAIFAGGAIAGVVIYRLIQNRRQAAAAQPSVPMVPRSPIAGPMMDPGPTAQAPRATASPLTPSSDGATAQRKVTAPPPRKATPPTPSSAAKTTAQAPPSTPVVRKGDDAQRHGADAPVPATPLSSQSTRIDGAPKPASSTAQHGTTPRTVDVALSDSVAQAPVLPHDTKDHRSSRAAVCGRLHAVRRRKKFNAARLWATTKAG